MPGRVMMGLMTRAGPTRRWGGWLALKVLATGYLASDMADSVSRADELGPGALVLHLSAGVAGVLLCWWPLVGILATVACMSLAMFVAPIGADLSLLVLVPLVLLPRIPRSGMPVLVGSQVAYCLLVSWRHGDGHWLDDAGTRLVVTALATLAGIAVRGFSTQLQSGARRIQELEHERALIRVNERTRLARELHDIVAHQLAIICLQTLGHRASDDPVELGQAMDRIDHAARTAVSELHELLNVMDDDLDAVDSHPLAGTADAPAELRALASTLVEGGFRLRLSVPVELAEVADSAQLTLTRVAREATTNILRHASPGGLVQIEVDVQDELVTLAVTNRMRQGGALGPLDEHSLGRGMRGLAERVDLAAGVLEIGPLGPDWVVRVSLPTHLSGSTAAVEQYGRAGNGEPAR